ncbi:MAG: NAD kinase [Bacilli bacterium]
MEKQTLNQRFTVLTRGDNDSNTVKSQIESYLKDFGWTQNDEDPFLVISVGGDGTLLQAFHTYKHRLDKSAFVGVHTGHLGFYADWLRHEIEKLVIHIAKTPSTIVQYPLLEISVEENSGTVHQYLALNECTVRGFEGTFVVDVDIRDMIFERFRGDGLCVSTPSGSTAYNKALGGAIIHPSIEAIQIAEMASINNRIFRTIGSPLILPKHHSAVVRPVTNADFRLTVDHLSQSVCDVKSITFTVSDEKIRFARFRPFPFWKRVRDSFVGEE